MDKETKRKYNEKYYRDHRQTRKVNNKGLSVAEYDDLFESQGFGCAICGTRTNGECSRDFEVDYSSGGMVRGLLCSRCKTGINSLNLEMLTKAIEYLTRE